MSPSVLFVASECAPLVKTGGLGDVAGALPPALRREGVDVRVLLPGYPAVLAALPDAAPWAAIDAWAGLPAARVLAAALPGGVPGLVVDCPELYARAGGPYQDESGHDWADNARRFGLLARAAAAIALGEARTDWPVQVLHVHDWQAALAAAYVAFAGTRRVKTIVTIHNLAFQGGVEADWRGPLGIPEAAWSMHGVEYYGKLSLLKAGLFYADAITTVSPTYAREIQTAPLGMGLEGLLAARAHELVGIVNGIDADTWNPRTDPHLAARYSAASLWRKRQNRDALARRVGLAARAEAPILGMVSRLTHQKGVDLVLAAAERLLALPAQLVVVGTGDRAVEAALRALAERHPGDVATVIGFDEALAHLLEAGADAFLMPSRFEPCGMNQMYSQRYGTPPIVHATGGLVDSVVDCDAASLAAGTAGGFAFAPASPEGLLAAVERCVAVWRDAPAWKRLQQSAMARAFDWSVPARRYVELYAELVAAGGG